jgi:D-beta-D-heptose 7-phosphate kinase/D-beta-D-heptose 1-phosphate adenosyltransferase
MPFSVDFDHCLDNLVHTHLLCLGDIMLDCFIYGRVERISPEAPVPIFHMNHKTMSIGGAGNVVRNLSVLGVETSFCGVIGKDNEGTELKRLVKELPKTTDLLIEDTHRPTTQKIRYLAHNQQILRADNEATFPLSFDLQEQVRQYFQAQLSVSDGIIFSDYGKGMLPPSLLKELFALAKQAGKPIIVDPKGLDYSIYYGATVLTPNLRELSQAARMPVSTDEQVVEAALSLINKYAINAILVTRSEQGMSLIRADQKPFHIPTHAIEVFDVSGAGDTVIAAFSAALVSGASLEESAFLANIAAGLVVAKVGTATVSSEEIRNLVNNKNIPFIKNKNLNLSEANDIVIQWKRQGMKIGFTNGCFDLLHPGHIALLREARAKCDKLIIGLNSNESIQRLKGPQRPIQSQEARAMVLASLEMVDMVVIFEEDTPINLIHTLRPAVLIKGADYTLDKVVGAHAVQSWGGEVLLVELIPEQSTTRTVHKIEKAQQGSIQVR